MMSIMFFFVPTCNIEPAVTSTESLVTIRCQFVPEATDSTPLRTLPHAEEPGTWADTSQGDVPLLLHHHLLTPACALHQNILTLNVRQKGHKDHHWYSHHC